jgi:UrcA family protein
MLKAISALGAIAVASVLLVPTASLASTLDGAELVTASVSYADLNLSQAGDVESLRYRIKGTAQSLCGSSFRYELVNGIGRRVCVSDAVASAQPAFEAAVGAARRGSVIISSGASLLITARR